LDALLDRANRIETNIVVPEGSRVGQIVEAGASRALSRWRRSTTSSK